MTAVYNVRRTPSWISRVLFGSFFGEGGCRPSLSLETLAAGVSHLPTRTRPTRFGEHEFSLNSLP